MPNAAAASVIDQALYLRKTYPKATALEVLDAAMEGRHGASLDFADESPYGTATHPCEPFGQLVVAAFDQGMEPEDWLTFLGEGSDPRPHADLLRVHATYVMPRFAARYSLWGAAEQPSMAPQFRSLRTY